MSRGRKDDGSKLRYDLLPVLAEEQVVAALTFGATKYAEPIDDPNYRHVEHPSVRYYSAARRHLAAWRKGETLDPDSKLHHLAHAATNILFILQLELELEAASAKEEQS